MNNKVQSHLNGHAHMSWDQTLRDIFFIAKQVFTEMPSMSLHLLFGGGILLLFCPPMFWRPEVRASSLAEISCFNVSKGHEGQAWCSGESSH